MTATHPVPARLQGGVKKGANLELPLGACGLIRHPALPLVVAPRNDAVGQMWAGNGGRQGNDGG